jgi:hypothetical protein
MAFRPSYPVLGSGLALAVAALTTAALTAPAAQAARAPHRAADPVTCSITSTSPSSITLGPTAETVRFGVHTSCDSDHTVNWDLNAETEPDSSGFSWLMLRNYHYPFSEKFTHVENAKGDYTVNFVGDKYFDGNWMVGPHSLSARAYYDANGNGRPDGDETVSQFSGSVVAKRATTFGTSFSASPKTLKRGKKLKITGALTEANWDTGTYDGFAVPVTLQFRKSGTSRYKDIKPVTDDGTAATTTVIVTTTGYWRYHYAGSDVTGSSNSDSSKVVVTK